MSLSAVETASVPPGPRASGRAGFTLIELLAVIAIIGLLAAIVIPTVGAARVAAQKARSRVLFAQWSAAIEAFRHEYGHYPVFAGNHLVNGGAGTDSAAPHPFHDLLAARRRDGTALPPFSTAALLAPEAQNRRRIAFFAFSEPHFTAGRLLGDGSGNAEIAVLVDGNLDGRIDAADYPSGWPAVAGLRPGPEEIPLAGLRTGAAFYAPAPGATADRPAFVTSW